MDTLINGIMGLSVANDFPQLLTLLKGADNIWNNQQINLLEAVGRLDAMQHSLGFMYILLAHAKRAQTATTAQFIEATSHFLRECAAVQVQMAPDALCDLCRRYKEQVIAAQCPRLGVRPLTLAAQKLQPSPEHLTPIHADALQLCLLSKCYAAGLPLLEGDLLQVEPAKTALTPTDFLLYCYYGGMVCIGRKVYSRALELLLQALTAPTLVANAITLACFKKYVLVSLIALGSLPPLPKFTSPKVRSLAEVEGKAYNDLATAYASHNLERLKKAAEQHSNTFHQDTNTGLVKLMLASMPMRIIQRLTQTYVTLSLTDIAKAAGLAGPEEAEGYILRMVASGEVHARINERDGMVTFLEDPEQYCSAAMAQRLDAAIKQSQALAERAQMVSEALAVDRSYLNKLVMKESRGFTAAAQAADDYGPASMGLYGP